MRTRLAILISTTVWAGCTGESSQASLERPAEHASGAGQASLERPAEHASGAGQPAPSPKTEANPATKALAQPEGEPPRVVVGDCYGSSQDAAALDRRRHVTARLRQHAAELTACYQASLDTDPTRFGALTVSFTLDAAGRARSPKATEFPDPDAMRCVARTVEATELGPGAEVEVECRLAFGYAPVKSMADRSKRIEVSGHDTKVDWAAAGPLPTIRAQADTPSSAVLAVLAGARAAGVDAVGFEIPRQGRDQWKYAYLPILPSAEPRGPTGRLTLTVFLEASRIRIVDTAGKSWNIDHAGPEPNFAMVADVLRARKSKPGGSGVSPTTDGGRARLARGRHPELAHRTDIELAPAPQVPYSHLAATLSLLAAQKFTAINVVAPESASAAAKEAGER